MTIPSLPQGFSFTPAGAKIDEPAAAREFEALLIARLLKTARQAGEALAGTSKQTGEEGYLEIAEEHIARVMAERGAFGISRILVKSLAPTAPPGAAAPQQAESPRAGIGPSGPKRPISAVQSQVFRRTADKNREGEQLEPAGGAYGNIPVGRQLRPIQ